MNNIFVCITTYNRPKELAMTLESLVKYNTSSGYDIVISDDCSTDKEVFDTIGYFTQQSGKFPWIMAHIENVGASQSVNDSFKEAIKHGAEYLIHLDPDIIIPHENWIQKLVDTMKAHPEVGLLAPDYPKHHLRLHRGVVDFVDYCMGGIFCITKEVFEKTNGWDSMLTRQQEPDFALRVRLKGYQVALLLGMEWIHLAPDYVGADQKIGDEGVFNFMRKWNKYFLGYFSYKSPLMLTWDEYPPNYVLRKQIFAQNAALNLHPETQILQDHTCELITIPYAPNAYREQEILKLLELCHGKIQDAEYNKIDRDLLIGKRKWTINDFKKEQGISL